MEVLHYSTLNVEMQLKYATFGLISTRDCHIRMYTNTEKATYIRKSGMTAWQYHQAEFTLLYSGKLSREKTFSNWWKIQFSRRKISQIAHFVAPKVPHPQILWRKLSQIATKLWNSRKFSPLKVSRYTVIVPMVKKMPVVTLPNITCCRSKEQESSLRIWSEQRRRWKPGKFYYLCDVKTSRGDTT